MFALRFFLSVHVMAFRLRWDYCVVQLCVCCAVSIVSASVSEGFLYLPRADVTVIVDWTVICCCFFKPTKNI